MKKTISSIGTTVMFFLTATPAMAAGEFEINIPTPPSAVSNIGAFIAAGIQAAIIIAGLLTFLYLVWGGIEWLTSGGDKEKYESARSRITAAVIGLVIVVAAYAIMKIIAFFVGIEDFANLEFPSWTDF